VPDQRAGVEDTGDAQRAPEGAPTLRQREASRIGMHVGSPTRQFASRIGEEAVFSSAPDRDHAQQLGGRSTLPATHTGAHRPRASYHRESLPPPTGDLTAASGGVIQPPNRWERARRCVHSELASGSGTPPLGRASEGFSVSGRMSIRHPVNLAASRAFWPSRPMARDSW
jgi:hypothetical protein